MTDHAPDSDSARSTPRESDALFDRLLAGDLSPEEIDALPDDMKEAARSIKDGSELFGRQSVLKTTLGKESRPMLAPRRFGRFVLIEEIGRGGQGAVWRAEDTERGDEVALKYLDRWVRSKKEPLARFVREQTILLRLNHDAIARVRDSGVERGVPWIAMEFVPGVSLSAWIEAKRKHGDAAPLDDQKRLLRFFIAAARGLHTAHAAGVVHRDIKPGNIMVRPDGSPVILDFGLARDLLDSNALTETGDLLGTPAYLAPEQLTRQSIPADHRTDVYGLGAAIYEAFTGRLPFVEPTRERLYAAILTSEPPPMHTIKKSIGKPLSLIVATALEKDRNRRYAGADLFADDLERALDEKPILARPLSWPAQIARAARRRPAAAVACVLLLLIFALGGFIAARWGDIERGQEADRRDEIAAALEHGYLLLGEGEPDDARRAFERAIELDEMTLEAWVGRIILESNRRNLDEARRLLTEAEKRFGRASALSPIERRLRAPVDHRAAVEFDATTADDLTLFVEGQLILADAHRGGGAGFADACRLLQMACLRSDHVRRLLVFELSHAATHAKDANLLGTVTHDLTRRWPDSSKAHFWSGFADIESAPDRAVEKFRRTLAIEPDLYVARYNLAHCLNMVGRYEESMIETDAILAARPGNADAALTKADGLIALGRAEDALKVIDAMTIVPAVEARAELARAKAEIDLRRYDRAIQVLDKMIELGRLPNLARLQRSFAHFALGRSKEGFSDLEKCLEDDPDNLEALTTIVRALIETLQFDRCVPYAEKIVEKARAGAASRAVAAFGFAMAKEFRRALEVADTVRLAPNDNETAVSLARTYYAIGAEDRAVEIARTYSDRDPRARWLLARSAFDHGRFEEASALWKRTIEESAKFPSLASTTKQELEAADRFQARARRARELRIADAGIDATPAEASELAFAAAMSGDFESFDWIETKSRPMRKPDETFDYLWLVKLRAQAIKLESTDPADLAGRKAAAAKLARDVDRFIEDLEIAREESPASAVIKTLDGSVESSPFLRLLHTRAKLDPESAKLLETALDRLLKFRRELATELKRSSTK